MAKQVKKKLSKPPKKKIDIKPPPVGKLASFHTEHTREMQKLWNSVGHHLEDKDNRIRKLFVHFLATFQSTPDGNYNNEYLALAPQLGSLMNSYSDILDNYKFLMGDYEAFGVTADKKMRAIFKMINKKVPLQKGREFIDEAYDYISKENHKFFTRLKMIDAEAKAISPRYEAFEKEIYGKFN